MKTSHKLNLLGAVSTIALMSFLIASLIAVQPAHSAEIDYKLAAGLWTEHYYHDKPDYNEKNEMIQLTAQRSDRYFLTAATFRNSHFVRSHMIGAGREFQSEYIDDLKWGLYLASVHGYEGFQHTPVAGLLFAPVSYYKYKYFRITVFGPAINAAIEVDI